MSGLEALSLACNIIQIIDCACEATRLCKVVYQNGKFDPQLEDVASYLGAVAKEAQAHHAAIPYKTNADLRLEEMASKCLVAARELNEEIVYLQKGSKHGNLVATLRVAVKVNWRKRRLERLEASLQQYQTIMQTQLLSRLCKQYDAAALSQRVEFDHLNAMLQQLVAAHSSGQTNVSVTVQREAAVSRTQAVAQSRRVEKSMKTHVSRTSATLERNIGKSLERHSTEATNRLSERLQNLTLEKVKNDQRRSFLESFKFPEMNGRINTLEDAHDQTFNWIFDEATGDRLKSPGDLSNADDSRSFPVRGWDDLAEWLKSEGNIYWISGLPGSGKSTLVKFLVAQEKTRDALNTWRPQVHVLHHFFWKPGNHMQNSVRGMLCSLLYQLLHESQTALAALCESQPSLLIKSTCSDWSSKELQQLIFVLLRDFSPVCIFVDGLDEAPELDYCRSLLDLLQLMGSLPGVKICAASRPEPLLKRRLESYPHLRLQDLTARDLATFTGSAFKPVYMGLDYTQEKELDRLTDSLVRKAEGVFLWLRLAVNDTLRDLEHGYPVQEIHEKVDRLPRTLTALYLDMWSRLNDHRAENFRVGAEIFNLVIDFKSYSSMLYSSLPAWMSATDDRLQLHLGDVLAMTDTEMQTMKPTTASLANDNIARRLEQVVRKMETHCAGLLSVTESSEAPTRTASHSAKSQVDFIHRTAYDFLVDTEEGQKIRSPDNSSPEFRCLRLLRGLITASRTMGTSSVQLSGLAKAPLWFLPPLRNPEKPGLSLSSHVNGFLEECSDSFQSGHFADSVHWPGLDRTALLCLCLAVPTYYAFVRNVLSQLPPPARARTATIVLRHIRTWWVINPRAAGRWIEPDYRLSLVQDLLSFGASPYEYGPIFTSTRFRKNRAFTHYCNAAIERCVAVIDAWSGRRGIWSDMAEGLTPTAARIVLGNTVSSYEELDARTYIAFQFGNNPDHPEWPELSRYCEWHLNWDDQYDGDKDDGTTIDTVDRPVDIPADVTDEDVPNLVDGSYFSVDSGSAFEWSSLIMEVNMAYLLRAIALRIAYHENSSSSTSVEALENFAPGFTHIEPYASLKYIAYRSYPASPSETKPAGGFRVYLGQHSQRLQELINAHVYSEVVQSDATNVTLWNAYQALSKSNELHRIFEPIVHSMAREKLGWISYDDCEKE